MTIPNSVMIDQPWQKKMPADSSKLTQKKGFYEENWHFLSQFTPLKMMLQIKKNPI